MCLYKSINEIKAANLTHSTTHGRSWWFERGAMEFFQTQVEPKVYHGCYFITSSQCTMPSTLKDKGVPDLPRKWTVHLCTPEGIITTIGEFQAHASLQDAERAIGALENETDVTDYYGKVWHIPDNCPDVTECES